MKHLLALLICLPTLLWAQLPISGQWTGELVQDPGGVDNRYHYTVTLTKTGETSYKGTSRIVPIASPEFLGVMRLNATLEDGILHVEEYAIDTSRIRSGYQWCLKSYDVRVERVGDSLRVSGLCKGETTAGYACSDASVSLSSYQPEKPKEVLGRNVKEGQLMHVTSNIITLEIYDDLVMDGDRISINFNGKWIIKNKKLKKKPFTVELNLNEGGTNYLVLHAENLGKQPPNTAAVRVLDGASSQKITLSSDLESSDYVRFEFGE